MDNPIYSIITATYNREVRLERAYQSVVSLTSRNFEWLVIDDGSSDGTKSQVEKWRGEADFPIHYVYQENAGKHSALNRAVQMAKGTYSVILDSDDELLSDTLEKFAKMWAQVPPESMALVSSVVGNCQDQNGELIGTVFPQSPLVSDSLEVRLKYKVKGDKMSSIKLEIWRQFPFPTFEQKGSLYEDVVWFEMSKHYKEVYFNEILLRVHLEEASITRQAIASKQAFAGEVRERMFINNQLRGFKWDPMYYFRCAANYRRCGMLEGRSFAESLNKIEPAFGKVLVVLGEIPARIKYWSDIRKERHQAK